MSTVHELHPVTQDPDFTRRNREWFTQRYDFASGGVYFPHQPVYGFSRFDEHVQDYVRTYNIVRLLEEIEFDSFLDVGCAEGYVLNVVRHCFGVRTCGVDIAQSAIDRARELYGLDGIAADARRLPLPDKAYDVVLCSETLEHVAEPAAVIAELLRVARRYVIITTPAARNEAELAEHFQHLDPKIVFAHFHFFTEQQMRAWLPEPTQFLGLGHRSMQPAFHRFSSGYDQAQAIRDLVAFIAASTPGAAEETLRGYQRLADGMVTAPPSLWRRMLGRRAMACALRLEHRLSRRNPRDTLAFLTLTRCDGLPIARRRRPVPGLLRYLLWDNRVAPLNLAAAGSGSEAPRAVANS